MLKPSQVIYIVDDDVDLCKALRWLMESVGLKVEVYYNAIDFLTAYQVTWQGCLLLDVRMPQMSGLQLQEKLIEMGNLIPIIMVSGHGDISMAVRAMKAGAVDFIVKPFNDQLLLEQIQNALVLNKQFENKQLILNRYKTLTLREQQVMADIVEGKMNKQIAYDLNISSKTVELHRAHVMQKMGAKNLAELVKIHFALTQDNHKEILASFNNHEA